MGHSTQCQPYQPSSPPVRSTGPSPLPTVSTSLSRCVAPNRAPRYRSEDKLSFIGSSCLGVDLLDVEVEIADEEEEAAASPSFPSSRSAINVAASVVAASFFNSSSLRSLFRRSSASFRRRSADPFPCSGGSFTLPPPFAFIGEGVRTDA